MSEIITGITVGILTPIIIMTIATLIQKKQKNIGTWSRIDLECTQCGHKSSFMRVDGERLMNE